MTILQSKIKESSYNNTDLAYALGISELSMYRKATGKSKIKRGEMQILSNMLKLTLEDQGDIYEELENLRR